MAPSAPELAKSLGDEHWRVRRDAAAALEDLGPEAAVAIPAIGKHLEDPNWRVRQAAWQTIGGLTHSDNPVWINSDTQRQTGSLAVSEMTLRMSDVDPLVRKAANESLGTMHLIRTQAETRRDGFREAVPELVVRLGDDAWRVREAAAQTVAGLGAVALPAVPALTKLLADSSYSVRRAAKDAIVKLGKGRVIVHLGALAGPSVAELTLKLKYKDWHIPVAAAWGLGQAAGATVVALPELERNISDSNAEVRLVTVQTVGALGALAAPAIPALAKTLLDGEAAVRSATRVALRRFAESVRGAQAQASPRICRHTRSLQHDKATEREEAAQALGRLGSESTHAVAALALALLDEEPMVSQTAASAFDQLQREGVLGQPSDASSAPVVATLLERLQDQNWAVRLAAAEALANLTVVAARCFSKLHYRTDYDDSEHVRKAGNLLLRRLRKAGALVDAEQVVDQILPELLEVLAVGDPEVRNVAYEALRGLWFADLLGDLTGANIFDAGMHGTWGCNIDGGGDSNSELDEASDACRSVSTGH